MAASTGVASLRRGGVETGGPLWSPAVLPWLWIGALALAVQLLLIKVVAQQTSPTTLIVWVVFASHLAADTLPLAEREVPGHQAWFCSA